MSDNGGLPRYILDGFAKDLRSKRFFERLQDQAMVLLPEQIAVINAAIEDAQGSADDAFTLAHAANTRPIDDIELLPLVIQPENDCELLPIFIQSENDCELLPLQIFANEDAELLPIPVIPLETKHGWARYRDTVYTEASPFSIAEGTTAAIPNNAGSIIDLHLPLGVASFYDGTKIRPDEIGDYCIVTIRFKASSSKLSGYAEVSIDIGGTQGQIFKNEIGFPKGVGTLSSFNVTLPCFMFDTFKANGGIVKVEAISGNLTLCDISYQIVRVFSAQGVL